MATEDKRIDQLPAATEVDPASLLVVQRGAAAERVSIEQLQEYLSGLIGSKDAVLYVEQTLTEEQKRQARENIRCGSVGEVGDSCVASGEYSHAEGVTTVASGQASHAEGGAGTTASGGASHAEGYATKSTGHASHSEGRETEATAWAAHAEGYGSKANYDAAHAEGSDTIASGNSSHAEGYNTKATESGAHAEGGYTCAYGMRSHAEGVRTIAGRADQHVQGSYNIEDTGGENSKVRGKYAHIVGNGTADDARANAHTLDWGGVPWYAGDRVMLGGTGMDDENAVALMPIFTPQQLTEEQKQQARANIGAASSDTMGAYEIVGSVVTTEPVTLISFPMGEHTLHRYKKEMIIEMSLPKNAEAPEDCHIKVYFNNEASAVPVISVYNCQSGAFGPVPRGYNTRSIYETRIIGNTMFTARYMNNYGANGYPQSTFTTTTDLKYYPPDSGRWNWLNILCGNSDTYPAFPTGTEVIVYAK